MNMQTRPNLSTRIGEVRLANPVMSASGTFGYGDEAPDLTGAAQLGALVTKTVTVEPRSGNPMPRLQETPSGLLNSIGLQNVGVDRFVERVLPRLRELGVPIVVSIGGRRPEEFADTARRLDGAAGVTALEVNISCPNVREGGVEFSQTPDAAAGVVTAVRAATRLPLWAKLSPNVTRIGIVARACEEAGADGITAINTLVGMSVDVRTRRSRLATVTGGLSGPAIRPVALAKVRELLRATSLPVIGAGGIVTAQDALEFLILGARAVQIGTASFADPRAGATIVEGIGRFLEREGLSSLEALIGTFRED